ncbi:MAG TPA: NAD-dependent epimerase/dehydratase family protein [Cyclobacteriaceae bacterium]|nr:NAD-dependent epimerase/dehydratase family protein [Cyclobacteriaceae bacterium]
MTRVLLTGGSGFLGKIVYDVLSEKRCKVTRLGRSGHSEIIADLCQDIPVIQRPVDIVVHSAGKAHVVPKSTKEQRQFFRVNVTGTSNLLKGIGLMPVLPRSIILISSVSVYGLTEGVGIGEDHPLEANDAYGRSKLQAENLALSWCEQNKVPLTILRLPLIAGPNPPGNLGTMIRGIKSGYYVNIGGGKARKSMVMAADVANILPEAAAHPGIYHLTDGHHPSLKELGQRIAAQLGTRPPRSMPLPIARALGYGGDAIDILFPGKAPISSKTIAKLTASLTFDDALARKTLGWDPHRVIDAFTLH